MKEAFKQALSRRVAEIKRAKDVFELNPKKDNPDFYLQRVGSRKTVGRVHDKIPDKGLPSTYIGVKVKPPHDPELVKIGFKGHKITGAPELKGMGTAQQFVRKADIQGMKFDYPSEGKANKNAQSVIANELKGLKKMEMKRLEKMNKTNKLLKALSKAGGSSSGLKGGGSIKIPKEMERG